MGIFSKLTDLFRQPEVVAPDELSPEMSIKEFFEKEYRPRRLLSCSKCTLKVYNITIKFFSEFLGREAKLSDLSDTSVAAFAEQRMEVVSRATVKRDLDQLLALWRFAHTAGALRKGPLMRNISVPTPTPIALTREQLEAVWEAIQLHAFPVVVNVRPERVTVPGKLWWSAIFLVCWDTGERIGAVLGLKECNLDLDGGWARFPAHDRKGGTADNLKSLADDTVEALRDLLDCYAVRRADSGIFRWANNKCGIWSNLGTIMKHAGLPNSREFKFHCIRKSSASHLAAAGGDARAHAGHSSDKITREHYLDPRIVGGPAAHSLLFRPGTLTSRVLE